MGLWISPGGDVDAARWRGEVMLVLEYCQTVSYLFSLWAVVV